jgi:hypothetical protein
MVPQLFKGFLEIFVEFLEVLLGDRPDGDAVIVEHCLFLQADQSP